MARAAAEGHRVVLVVCTNGDHGEVPDDLGDGESLVDRRRQETATSAAVLGVARVAWLGYRDSGMMGWPQNDDPESFWQADRRRRRGAAGGDPARGGRRRRRALRLARRLRPPRPHPGPSRRPPGGRPGRHPEALRGDLQPRRRRRPDGQASPDRAGLRSERAGRRRQPVRHAGGRDQRQGRRVRLHAAEAPGAGVPTPARSPTSACSSPCPTTCSRRSSAPSGTSSPAPRPGLRTGWLLEGV